MFTGSYSLRPSDGASVPVPFGVLGITSPRPAGPPGGVLGPSSRSILGPEAPYHPSPRPKLYLHITSDLRTWRNAASPFLPLSLPARRAWEASGWPIFPGTGIPLGGGR
jgi:hypothetical protein